MSDEADDPLKKRIKSILGVTFVLSIVMVVVGLIASIIGTGFCYYRYSYDDQGVLMKNIETAEKSVSVLANGNYDQVLECDQNMDNCQVTQTGTYGQWLNADIAITTDTSLTVEGTVSMCKATLPTPNVQTTGALTTPVYIPKAEDGNAPLYLAFPANTGKWLNIAKVFPDDVIQVALVPTVNSGSYAPPTDSGITTSISTSGTTQTINLAFSNDLVNNSTAGSITAANCSDKSTSATNSPLCGRTSIYKTYLSACTGGYKIFEMTCSKNQGKDTAPRPYLVNGKNVCGSNDGYDYAKGIGSGSNKFLPAGCTIQKDSDSFYSYSDFVTKYGTGVTIPHAVRCKMTSTVSKLTSQGCSSGDNKWTIDNGTATGNAGNSKYMSCIGTSKNGYHDYCVDCHHYNYYCVSESVTSNIPPYDFSGSKTFAHTTNLNDYKQSHLTACDQVSVNAITDPSATCTVSDTNAALNTTISGYKFWMTDGDGLMYRYNTSSSASTTLGSTYTQVAISKDASNNYLRMKTSDDSDANAPYYLVNSLVSSDDVTSSGTYLQLRYIDNGNASDNTGGYMLAVRQSSCNFTNGLPTTSTTGGQLEYILTTDSDNPNTSGSAGTQLTPSVSGDKTVVTIPADSNATKTKLWLRINNVMPNQRALYSDATGSYTVTATVKSEIGVFSDLIINKIFGSILDKTSTAGLDMFKSMTCYHQTDTSSCFSFFSYLNGLLTLYVLTYGMLFLLGKAGMTSQELFTRVVKIIIVSSLMNGDTFDFFNTTVFPFFTNFTDGIIAALTGMSPTSPFAFLDEFLSGVFFSPRFQGQLLSLMSRGIIGPFYFAFALTAIINFIIVGFEAIVVYLMSKVFLSFLIGLAPLFISMILFEQTKGFFKKWISSMLRCVFEPMIVIFGLVIMTQLFMVFLDSILGFSICWKCALPIKSPAFPGIPAFIASQYIACIYWFAPWGMAPTASVMAVPLGDIAILIMLSRMATGYLNTASSLTTMLTNTVGGASTIGMAKSLTHAVKNMTQSAIQATGADKYASGQTDKLINSATEKIADKTGVNIGGGVDDLAKSLKDLGKK